VIIQCNLKFVYLFVLQFTKTNLNPWLTNDNHCITITTALLPH